MRYPAIYISTKLYFLRTLYGILKQRIGINTEVMIIKIIKTNGPCTPSEFVHRWD